MGSDFPRGLRDNTVITGREMNVYTMGLVLTTDNTQPNTTCGSAVQKVYHLWNHSADAKFTVHRCGVPSIFFWHSAFIWRMAQICMYRVPVWAFMVMEDPIIVPMLEQSTITRKWVYKKRTRPAPIHLTPNLSFFWCCPCYATLVLWNHGLFKRAMLLNLWSCWGCKPTNIQSAHVLEEWDLPDFPPHFFSINQSKIFEKSKIAPQPLLIGG